MCGRKDDVHINEVRRNHPLLLKPQLQPIHNLHNRTVGVVHPSSWRSPSPHAGEGQQGRQQDVVLISSGTNSEQRAGRALRGFLDRQKPKIEN